MKKKILVLGIVVAVVAALVVPMAVMAADEDTVDCTVTGSLLEVSVTDGAVAYGVLALSATEDTVTLGATQTATNDGTETIDLDIKSSNAIGGTQWTLGVAQGADTFTHEASIDSGTTWPSAMTVADTYVALVTAGIAPAGTQTFDLQIGMPSSITDYTQKTITVTILATVH